MWDAVTVNGLVKICVMEVRNGFYVKINYYIKLGVAPSASKMLILLTILARSVFMVFLRHNL